MSGGKRLFKNAFVMIPHELITMKALKMGPHVFGVHTTKGEFFFGVNFQDLRITRESKLVQEVALLNNMRRFELVRKSINPIKSAAIMKRKVYIPQTQNFHNAPALMASANI